jgi:membrane protein insertase Oxa1/YidC/SpoIIIJ
VCIGAVSLFNLEWNVKTITASTRFNMGAAKKEPFIPRVLSNLSRVAVLFFTTISFQAPVALCLYWLASNTFSALQNVLLDYYLPLAHTPKRLNYSTVIAAIKLP